MKTKLTPKLSESTAKKYIAETPYFLTMVDDLVDQDVSLQSKINHALRLIEEYKQHDFFDPVEVIKEIEIGLQSAEYLVEKRKNLRYLVAKNVNRQEIIYENIVAGI